LDSVAQALPLDEGHGEPEVSAGVARVVHGEDVGMLQSRGELDLTKKTLGPEACRELGMKDLERHRPLVPEILSEEDGRPAAATELPLDRVAVSQRVSKLATQISH